MPLLRVPYQEDIATYFIGLLYKDVNKGTSCGQGVVIYTMSLSNSVAPLRHQVRLNCQRVTWVKKKTKTNKKKPTPKTEQVTKIYSHTIKKYKIIYIVIIN